MLSRQSGDRPATWELERSRSTMASRDAISSALVRCLTSQLFFSQSCKLTFVPDQEDFFALHHGPQEMVFRSKLGAQFGRGVHRRVYLARESFLGAAQGLGCLRKRDFPNNHHVHVTGPPFLASCYRPVDEGRAYAGGDRRERGAQHVGDPGGFDDQAAKLWIDRTVRVGLEVHLTPLNRAACDA